MKLFKTICALSCIDANLYTGKSYKQNGHIRFQISSAKEAQALQKIENEFQIEWLAPHEGTATTVTKDRSNVLLGPDFSIGSNISIVTNPSDTAPVLKVKSSVIYYLRMKKELRP